MIFQPESELRHWLSKHGKNKFIDFRDEELIKLRNYFKDLDEDGSGSIGIEELEKPLISLGLCTTREDVKKIMEKVDEDKSGQIEFNEFLHIIKSASLKKEQNQYRRGVVSFSILSCRFYR
jgi:Ca2+-binding EF-hand superfamily protein